jgi:hypothetical protein
LDEELTVEQEAVLAVVHGELEQIERWPIWQYVDLLVQPYGAAWRAVSSMPRFRDDRQAIPAHYGLTWWGRMPMAINPQDQIELTVAGLHRLHRDELPDLYVRLIRHCIEQQTKLTPSPTQTVNVTLEFSEILGALFHGVADEVHTSGHSRKRLRQLRLGGARASDQGWVGWQRPGWLEARGPG